MTNGLVDGLGSTLDSSVRFRRGRRLGEGAMGVVYEAWGPEGRRIALKTLKSTDPEQLYRLKREFRSLARITHPNLVQLHELSGDDDGWVLAMEFVPGVDFTRYCWHGRGASDRPDMARVRGATDGLLSGVRALHEHGVLHRDLKPSNVIVTDGGRVVIVDFGLACALRSAESSLGLRSEAAGTAAYMAPEQVEATSALGPAVDWYAVGVMLFEALARRRPFEGPPFAVLARKQREAAPKVLSLVPDAAPDLAELCDRLLQRDPALRQGPFELIERREGSRAAVSVSVSVAASAAVDRTALAGRERELARLESEWRAAAGGAYRALIVRGESGMGKTALVREFVARARQSSNDALVLSGRCYPRESIPYRAVDEVMDQLGAFWKAQPAGPASYLTPREPEFLLRAFPTLGRVREVEDGASRRSALVPQDAAYRSLVACREVFQRLARLRPVIITLDDVQWIDVDSMRLLEFLGASHDAPALLLILSTRPSASGDERADCSKRVAALGPTLELTPLADAEMSRLIGSIVDPERIDQVPALTRAAAGNPFFGVRLAQCARRTPALAKLGIAGALSAQLSDHSELARAVLEVLSIAAAPLSARIIGGALGATLDAVHRELGALETDDLVGCAEPLGASGFELYHDRIRQAVSEQIAPERRRELHRALALEYAAHASDQPEHCARHFASAGEPRLASAHARRAAELAHSRLSFDRAAEYYRLCLQLGELSLPEECELRARLGDALTHGGYGLAAAEEYLLSARGAGALESLRLEQRAAEELLRAGYHQRGLEVLERTFARAGLAYEPSAARRGVRAVRSKLGGWLRARAAGERSLPEAELVVRVDLCAAAADCLPFCKPAYTRHYQTLHLRLAEQLGDASRICRALGTEVVFGALDGQLSEPVRRALRETQRQASLAGDDRALGRLAHYQGMVAFYRGEWQRAIERSVVAERRLVRSRSGTQWEIDNSRLYTTAALQIQGRLTSLRRRRERWLEEAMSRKNIFAQTMLRAGPARLVRIVRGEGEALRDDLREVMSFWPANELSIPRFWELEALTDLALYERRGHDALARFRALSTRRRPIPFMVQVTRVKLAHAHGRAAIAAAIERRADERELLELGAACVRQLEGERVDWAHALATLLRAGVAAVQRRDEQCRQLLAFAERQLLDADLSLDAWAVRHWLGRVEAGAAGKERVTRSSSWLTAQGVRDVAALVAMRAPGSSLY